MRLILKNTSLVSAFALLFGIFVASAGVLDPDAGLTAPAASALVNTIGVRLALVRPDGAGGAPFYVSLGEVTNGQWETVMGRWSPQDSDKDPGSPAAGHDQKAIRKFCRRLGAIEGREYRLPTAAEVELAGRALGALDETSAGFRIASGGDLAGALMSAGGAQVHGLYDEGPRIVGFPPPPPFPQSAKALLYEDLQGMSTLVSVEVVVGADGNPLSAQAICGAKLLWPVAAEYVRQCRFEPATVAGLPVAAKSVIAIPVKPIMRPVNPAKFSDWYIPRL